MGSADTIDPVRTDSVRIGMRLSQFTIGCEFLTASGRWRCTDVGTRTVVAIRLDLDHDPTWYEGPPYAVPEHVFDEYDLEDCSPVASGPHYDDSGRQRLVPLPRG